MESSQCIICCQPVPTEAPSFLKTLPGSNGSHRLNHILTIYFIAKKLLKFTDHKCLQIVDAIVNHSEKECRLCGSCEDIVNKAVECHQKILNLNEEIQSLGNSLSQIINETGESSVFREGTGDNDGTFQEISDPFTPEDQEDAMFKVETELKIECDSDDGNDENEDFFIENVEEKDDGNEAVLNSTYAEGQGTRKRKASASSIADGQHSDSDPEKMLHHISNWIPIKSEVTEEAIAENSLETRDSNLSESSNSTLPQHRKRIKRTHGQDRRSTQRKGQVPQEVFPLLMTEDNPLEELDDDDSELPQDLDIKIKTEYDDAEEIELFPHSSINETEIIDPVKVRIRRKKPSAAKKMIQCSLCRAQFKETPSKNKAKVKELSRLHMLQYHSEQLFHRHKLPHITDTQFKIILGEQLFKDLTKENNEGNETSCVYCNKRFSKPERPNTQLIHFSRVKGHLMKAHYQQLEIKLEKIQTQGKIQVDELDPDGNSKICECGAFIQNSTSRTTHENFYCPLTLKTTTVDTEADRTPSDFMSNFLLEDSGKVKCKLCNKIFNRANAARHWKYFCKMRGNLPLRKRASLACDYCDYKCKGGDNMKKHLIKYHPVHFFLKKRSKASKWKQRNFKRIVTDILFPKFFKVDGISTSCSVCGMKYNCKSLADNDMTVKRHLVCKHDNELQEGLEIILEETDSSLQDKLKLEEPVEVLVESFDCQFCGMECRDKHQKMRHETSVHLNKDIKPFMCHLCEKRFRMEEYLKNHLRLQHKLDNSDLYAVL